MEDTFDSVSYFEENMAMLEYATITWETLDEQLDVAPNTPLLCLPLGFFGLI